MSNFLKDCEITVINLKDRKDKKKYINKLFEKKKN